MQWDDTDGGKLIKKTNYTLLSTQELRTPRTVTLRAMGSILIAHNLPMVLNELMREVDVSL